MSLILSIETATKVCSVALFEDGRLLGSQDLMVDKSHAEYLAPMIHDLMKYTGREMKELTALAVSKGPGSYTGLRIGTSTAKGICYALGLPLISVNTLMAMAWHVNNYNINKFRLCPMLDARRMEIYYLLTDADLNVIVPTNSHIIDERSFRDELSKGPIIFFGNGMPKAREILSRFPEAFFLDNITPLAKATGNLALEKYKKGDFENTETFEPFYLKDFIAGVPKKMF